MHVILILKQAFIGYPSIKYLFMYMYLSKLNSYDGKPCHVTCIPCVQQCSCLHNLLVLKALLNPTVC